MNFSFDFNKYKFPNDWTKIKLKECLVLEERPIVMDDDKGYRLVTVKRNFGGIQERSVQKGKEILVKSQFVINERDFVISKRQIAHGACGVVPKELDNSIVSNEYNVFTTKENLNLNFFNYYVQLPFVKRYFYISSDGVHIEKLLFKTKDWLNRYIVIPSISEQNKIVNILKDWDLAIEKQQQLIEKKKEFKKGLMQRLLSGEVRFKEFTDEWRTVKLGEIFKERKETGFNDLELLAITTANGVVRRTEVDVKDNSSEDKSKYKRILPGDIGYNTMRMWQGVSGLSKYEGIVSPAYTILKPVENIDSLYMSYLFKTSNVINLFYRYSQGLVSDTLNLKYENFKDIKVKISNNIEEQKKISEVLKTADKEIDLLEKELEALKLQKKGLMQRLLTGEVRVKV